MSYNPLREFKDALENAESAHDVVLWLAELDDTERKSLGLCLTEVQRVMKEGE